MHSVQALQDKNRLIITLSGVISDEEVVAFLPDIVAQVQTLKPVFCVITDARSMKYSSPRTAERLKSVMALLQQRHCRYVVRVVGASKVALAQFMQFSKGIIGYKVSYVATMEDAEKICAKFEEKVLNLLASQEDKL